MSNDQGRLVQRLNHVGHGKRLTGTGDTQQRLKLIALPEAFHQFGNGLWLVAGRLIFGMQFEL